MFNQEKFSIQIITSHNKPFTNIQRDKSAIDNFYSIVNKYCLL